MDKKKVYVIVELYGGIVDDVHVYADEAAAKEHIDDAQKELGDRLDQDYPTAAISYDQEYETRMYECEVE